MKIFKSVNISSDGSLYFCHSIEISLSNKLISFQKQDEKTFSLNAKKSKRIIESKQSSYYKKKYFK